MTAILLNNQQANWRRQEKPTSQYQYSTSSCYSNVLHATLRHKLTNAVILFVKLYQRRVRHACVCFFKSSQYGITKKEGKALSVFSSGCNTVCAKAVSLHGHYCADLCGELLSALLCSADFSAPQLMQLCCPSPPVYLKTMVV